jgi:hypothetical protein
MSDRECIPSIVYRCDIELIECERSAIFIIIDTSFSSSESRPYYDRVIILGIHTSIVGVSLSGTPIETLSSIDKRRDNSCEEMLEIFWYRLDRLRESSREITCETLHIFSSTIRDSSDKLFCEIFWFYYSLGSSF